jgi:hypothetical protein
MNSKEELVNVRAVEFATQIKLGFACLTVSGIVAWLNRYHELQSGVYEGRYLALAKYFRGQFEEPLFTYPLWGYPLLLSWLSSPEITSIVLQLILATITILFVYSTAAPYLRFHVPLAILSVVAIPWYALASVKLADIYSASFGVMAICLLARAVKTQEWGSSIASGFLFGLSLNFRSDFFAGLFLIVILTAILSPRIAISNCKRLSIVLGLAILMLVPWGAFRIYHGKSFGFTSTNAGMVLYNSLGFPGNAWGIVLSDDVRTLEVEAAIGKGADPASEEGNAFFRERFFAAVVSDPVETVRKVAYNLIATFKLGFYTIETWTFLTVEERLKFEVLKEQLKFFAGAKPYLARIEEFRSRGLWVENFSLSSMTAGQWMLVAYPMLNSVLSALYLAAVSIAVGGILVFDRIRLREPILLFCVIGTLSVFSLIALVQYEPRQANVLYPLGMPLVAIIGEWVASARDITHQARLRQRAGPRSLLSEST